MARFPTSSWYVFRSLTGRLATLHLTLLAPFVMLACGGGDTTGSEDTLVDEDTSTPADTADTSVISDTAEPTDTTTRPDADTVEDTVADTEDTSVVDTEDTSVADTEDTTVADTEDTTVADTEDTTVADTGSDADTTPPDPCTLAKKGDGCGCLGDDECDSGACGDGSAGSTCVRVCQSDNQCSDAESCVVPIGKSDGLCLVPSDFACMPCLVDNDCRRAGGLATCESQGVAGNFCATPCQNIGDCAAGEACTGGKCVPSDGTCDCSAPAVILEASTTCFSTNTFGTCSGGRVCEATGLTACTALAPKNDVCNGADDDCDNQTDEVASACSDGDPCTQDVCDGLNGCLHPAVLDAANIACDDGNACTASDRCVGGACQPGTLTCECQTSADCKTPPIGKDLSCVTATCNASKVCVYANKTGSCNDASACTDNDACQAGACKGITKSCADTNNCTIDGCNAATGCTHTTTNGACDDQDACTKNDTCATGTCIGTGYSCDAFDDACHEGVCDGQGGCQSQALACGATGVRLHSPSAAFHRQGTGATWFVGSAGHAAPVGTSDNASHRINYGFHPGTHP